VVTRLPKGGGDEDVEPRLGFDVTDSGVGMTVERAAHLFQAFTQADTSTTRRFGDAGLGFNISKRLAQMCGVSAGTL